ncbi:MAG: hypothetical protein CFK48_04025 [Armatimonadetes bacterium CP1_7O]|nr:MAG: hypothetical protein CFK48_04025 [Armatimonadetes bacterium CP1_7O]
MGGLIRGRVGASRSWGGLTEVSGWARWSHALLLLGVLVMFGVGWYLTPNPEGHGTHRQLGLPPCTIYFLTGRPCPSCGLTTSVSAILHGQFGLAWRANPIGYLVVAAAVGVGLNSLLALVSGRTLRLDIHRLNLIMIVLLSLWLLHGVVRFVLA